MAKLRPGEKRVQLSFQRPEDLRLFAFVEREAYRCRWDVSTFILASLTEAFKDRMEEAEVEAIAAEAAQKVRVRALVPTSGPLPPAKPAKPEPVSMEAAARQAEAQIAQLDAIAVKEFGKRKRSSVPPMPK